MPVMDILPPLLLCRDFWSLAFGFLVITYAVYNIINNLFLSPLSRFPGPKLWAISRIPSQLSVLRGHSHLDISRLHEVYGPVVRIGPNELVFNTPAAFRDIYGSRPGQRTFLKDRNHYLPPANGVDHLLCAVESGVHARQRRLLSYAFSDRALKDQESLITKYVDLLIDRLREHAVKDSDEHKTKVDIKSWMNYTMFDITGDLMFSESFNCLEESQLHPWIGLIFNSIKALAIIGAVNQFPAISAILDKLIPRSVVQKGVDHFNLGCEKVDRRLEMGSDKPDFISVMLKNGLSKKDGQYGEDAKIMSRAELHSNAFILIIAGSETSATVLSGCIYYLCRHPTVMDRLINEIRGAFSTDSDINFNKTSTLTYLAAVIEESLRMYPPVVTGLARVPPAGGETVDGYFVPEGTTVSCHHYACYRSSSNFALPNEFIAERWLRTDTQFDSDKKDVLQPFSLGPQSCLGKNLAYAEIRLILCKLLFHFDIELCPESVNWVDQEVYFLWDKPALMVNLIERVTL
ncbi:hypothetical protein PVAR5_0124 [Paecilomyces variotii No. 5]|uniref:Cytochrome P450 n=1 Tax=Byssochlamys spectabilis (strain No. 5 / NBRC 109023) TaxID=1356009 RepID=V5FSH8_BYSSN|nr:hypothetical protein PVAR5_0124 [Paecilomyces variotii No. 5]